MNEGGLPIAGAFARNAGDVSFLDGPALASGSSPLLIPSIFVLLHPRESSAPRERLLLPEESWNRIPTRRV